MKRFQEAMQFFYKKHFKSSAFFNVFMNLGIFFFAKAKKNQVKESNLSIDEYVLFSSDAELKNRLEKQLQKKVHSNKNIDENMLFSQSRSGNTEIILDNNEFSFREIIGFLEKHKNKNLTFKIIPKESGFMIGSNNSNDRGQIIAIK